MKILNAISYYAKASPFVKTTEDKSKDRLRTQYSVRKRAYTLIEVLIVMSIIGVLVSFVLGASKMARAKAQKAKVYAMFDAIGAGLRLYNDSFLTYPPDDGFYCGSTGATVPTLSSEALCVHLTAHYQKGKNASIYAGPMMVFKPEAVQITSHITICDLNPDNPGDEDAYEIIDPWGTPIRYRFPPNSDKEYDLWSCGPDGTDDNGTGDDINNWE